MSNQQDALELTLAQLVQLLQEDTAVEELLVTLQNEGYSLVTVCDESNKLASFSWMQNINTSCKQIFFCCHFQMIHFCCSFK